MPDLYSRDHKLVATWVTTKDFEHLKQLALKHNVKLAAYIRAILVDAIQDEVEHNTISK